MDLNLLISFIDKLEKLKCTKRHSFTSDGRHESVAEHCWRLAAMVCILKDHLKGYDFDKMIHMALFHDIGEIKHGDIPAFDKTETDAANEKTALEEIASEYNDLSIAPVFDSVTEFDCKATKEARLMDALDKLEGLIQHNEADIETWIEKEYDLNMQYGVEECKVEEIISELRNLVKEITNNKIKERYLTFLD